MANQTTKGESEIKRPKQGRSPAYPGLTIQEALAKAKALYAVDGKYAVPMASAFKAWGYSEKSSGGRETRASLRYFGLIAVEGDSETGKVKLTEDALRILLDARDDQTEKKAIVRRLSMLPAIHKKLVEKFPDGFKSDGTVEHFLIFDEGYSAVAAKEVLTEFKSTATYTGIFQPDSILGNSTAGQQDETSEDDSRAGHKPTPAKAQQVKLMEGERIVFTEESTPQVYVKLVASGDVDEFLLEAIDDYVKRQRKRLAASQVTDKPSVANGTAPTQ